MCSAQLPSQMLGSAHIAGSAAHNMKQMHLMHTWQYVTEKHISLHTVDVQRNLTFLDEEKGPSSPGLMPVLPMWGCVKVTNCPL